MMAVNNRVLLARLLFILDAVLGILVVGAACLYGAAFNRNPDWVAIALTFFLPLSLAWSLLCYFAYKGLTSGNIVLKSVFWFYVFCNVFTFPIGTAIAGASIWLRREFINRKA